MSTGLSAGGDGCGLSNRIDSVRVQKRRRVELISGLPFDVRSLFSRFCKSEVFLYCESLDGFLFQKEGENVVVTAFHTVTWPGLGDLAMASLAGDWTSLLGVAKPGNESRSLGLVCSVKHQSFHIRVVMLDKVRNLFHKKKIFLIGHGLSLFPAGLLCFRFFYGACSPVAGYGLLIIEVFRDYTLRHTTVCRTPLDE